MVRTSSARFYANVFNFNNVLAYRFSQRELSSPNLIAIRFIP